MTDAGWYPDPSGRFAQRYFDGAQWTDHVSSRQPSGIDRIGGPPAASSYGYAPQIVVMQAEGNGLAVAGMVLGIVAVVVALFPFGFFLAIPLGLIGLILACVGAAKQVKRGMAIAGIVCSVGALAISALWIAAIDSAFEEVDSCFDAYQRQAPGDTSTPVECR